DGRIFPTLGSEDLEIRRDFHHGDFGWLLPEDLHIGRVSVADLPDGNSVGFRNNSKAARGRACAFEYEQMIFSERRDIGLRGWSGDNDLCVCFAASDSDRAQYPEPGTRG